MSSIVTVSNATLCESPGDGQALAGHPVDADFAGLDGERVDDVGTTGQRHRQLLLQQQQLVAASSTRREPAGQEQIDDHVEGGEEEGV